MRKLVAHGLKILVLVLAIGQRSDTFSGPNFSGISIAFFDDNHFKGMLHSASQITTSCETLPWWTRNKAASIYTKTCVILYSNPYCKGQVFRLEPGKGEILPDFHDEVASFRACDDVSRNSLYKDVRIKFYDETPYKDLLWDTPILPKCTNLGSEIWNKAASIQTDLCVVLYSHPDCEGAAFRLDSGKGETLPYFSDETDSFKPCDLSDVINGFRLTAKIYKFEYWAIPSEVATLSKTDDIEMGSTSTFWNRKNATITKPYFPKQFVNERAELGSPSSFSKIHEVSVATSIQMEAKDGIPLIAESKIEAFLTAGYTHFSTSNSSFAFRFHNQSVHGFSQDIELPPCSKYEITSFLKTIKNFPVHFKVFSEVSGRYDNGKPMTAGEVKRKLSGLEYHSNKDDFTVIATSENNMTLDFATDMVTNGSVIPIEGCPNKNKEEEDDKRNFKLHAAIYQFELWIDSENHVPSTNLIEMTPLSWRRLWNIRNEFIYEEYNATASVNEKVEIEPLTADFGKFASIKLRGSPVHIRTETRIPAETKAIIDYALTKRYQLLADIPKSDNLAHVEEVEKEFIVSESVEIPGCSEVEGKSFVEVVSDFRVEYVVFIEITGEFDNGESMTTSEIQRRLVSGLKYFDDKDETTIIAKSEGSLMLDFAVGTLTNKSEPKSRDCNELSTSDQCLRAQNPVFLLPLVTYVLYISQMF